MIETLLLDVDGVLVSSSPEFATAMDTEYAWRDGVAGFLRELIRHPREADTLIGDGDILPLVEELLPAHVSGLSATEFLDRWFTENIVVNVELINAIGRAGIKRVYLATNQDRRRGTYIHELFAQQPWHSGSLMSYDLGLAKPDPAYFAAALDRIGVPAGDCVFVDDRQANVDAARAAGIAAIQYRDLDRFTAELERLLGPRTG
ncbi:MAG TPA: HAD-IA family hydrolase [Micromonosporaceae bacterium]|jgi:putative hydrolase of the HAD superfamily